MLTSLVQSLANSISELLDKFMNMFLEALSISNLSTYLSVFPLLSNFYIYLRSFAVALTAIIAGKSLATFAMGSIDNGSAKDNPAMVLVKTFAAVALVYWGGYILEYIVYLGSIPYDAFLGIDTAGAIASEGGDAHWLDVTAQMVETMSSWGETGDLTIALAELFILSMVAWNIFKLVIEVCERWLMVGVLMFTSPLAYSTIPSNDTSQIFRRWVSMFVGAVLQMSLSVMFLKLIMSGFSSIGAGFLIKLLMIFAMCKIAQRVDSYLQQLGIGAPTTGGSMIDDLIAGYSSLKRTFGSGRGDNGGSHQSILGKSMSRSHLANAFGSAANAIRSGKSFGEAAKAGIKGYWNSLKYTSPVGRATQKYNEAKEKLAERKKNKQEQASAGANKKNEKASAQSAATGKSANSQPSNQSAASKPSTSNEKAKAPTAATTTKPDGKTGSGSGPVVTPPVSSSSSATATSTSKKQGSASDTKKEPGKAEKPANVPVTSSTATTKPNQTNGSGPPTQKPSETAKPSNGDGQKPQTVKKNDADKAISTGANSGVTPDKSGKGAALDPKATQNSTAEKTQENGKATKDTTAQDQQTDKRNGEHEPKSKEAHPQPEQGATLDPKSSATGADNMSPDSTEDKLTNGDSAEEKKFDGMPATPDQGTTLDPKSSATGANNISPDSTEDKLANGDSAEEKKFDGMPATSDQGTTLDPQVANPNEDKAIDADSAETPQIADDSTGSGKPSAEVDADDAREKAAERAENSHAQNIPFEQRTATDDATVDEGRNAIDAVHARENGVGMAEDASGRGSAAVPEGFAGGANSQQRDTHAANQPAFGRQEDASHIGNTNRETSRTAQGENAQSSQQNAFAQGFSKVKEGYGKAKDAVKEGYDKTKETVSPYAAAAKEGYEKATDAVYPFAAAATGFASAFLYHAGIGPEIAKDWEEQPLVEDPRDIERNAQASQDVKNDYARQYQSGNSEVPDYLATEAQKRRNGERASLGNTGENMALYGASDHGSMIKYDDNDNEPFLSDPSIGAGLNFATNPSGNQVIVGNQDAQAEFLARAFDEKSVNKDGDRTYAAALPTSRQDHIDNKLHTPEEYAKMAHDNAERVRNSDKETVDDYEKRFAGAVGGASYEAKQAKSALDTLQKAGADADTIEAAEQEYHAARGKLREATIAAGEKDVSKARDRLSTLTEGTSEYNSAKEDYERKSKNLDKYINSSSHDESFYRDVENNPGRLRDNDVVAFGAEYDKMRNAAETIAQNTAAAASPYVAAGMFNHPDFVPADCPDVRRMAEGLFRQFITDIKADAGFSSVKVSKLSGDGIERSIRVEYPRADGTTGSAVFYNDAASISLPLETRKDASVCKTADNSHWLAVGHGFSPEISYEAEKPSGKQVRRSPKVAAFFTDHFNKATTLFRKPKRR